MRRADPDEAASILLQLSRELDGEIPDRCTAVDVLDNWFEWVAGEKADMRVQLAYRTGAPVPEWSGIVASETLAYVTPASVLNSLFGSEFDGANLAFTPGGAVPILTEPDDPTS